MARTKRDDIFNAALTLMAEKGIYATTTREIAERAGTAEGNIYRHFKSKDELAQHLFDHSAEQFHEVLQRCSAEEASAEERLAGLVRGVFAFAEEHPEAFAYLLAAHRAALPQRGTGTLPPRPMQAFIRTLEGGIGAGVFRQVEPALATVWIVAMAQRAHVFAQLQLVPIARASVIEQTVEAALRLVRREA